MFRLVFLPKKDQETTMNKNLTTTIGYTRNNESNTTGNLVFLIQSTIDFLLVSYLAIELGQNLF